MTIAGLAPSALRGRSPSLVDALVVGLIVTLPLQSVPGVGRLPAPVANFVIVALIGACALTLLEPRPVLVDLRYSLTRNLALFFLLAVASVAYGERQLAGRGLSVLHLTIGDASYLSAALGRIVQLGCAIVALEAVRRSPLPTAVLMRSWLTGMLTVVPIHFAFVLVAGADAGRPGTFGEGNFAGLYYVYAVFLALDQHRRRPDLPRKMVVAVALLGLVLARSSTSFVALAAAFAFRRLLKGGIDIRRLIGSILWLIGGLGLLGLLIYTGYDFGLGAKLFTQEVTPDSFSRIDRLLSSATAAQIFLDHPLFGAGIQSYGFLANAFLSDSPVAFVYDYSFRRIPNNIYLEIAAELGIVGLVVFFGFIARLMRRIVASADDADHNIAAALAATLVYWVAFPTYSVIFVWAFFGLALRYETSDTMTSIRATGR